MRSRKDEKKYTKRKKLQQNRKNSTKKCPFCAITQNKESLVEETEYFYVKENIFPYTAWDLQRVVEHLMIVPKRCITKFSEMNATESSEYIQLVTRYDERGYNSYTRTANSPVKSVDHIHTHLIKTDCVKRNLLLFQEKPRFLLLR